MPPVAPNFIAVLNALALENVKFVLIGGLAMSAHGSDYVTKDIDIFYDRSAENVKKLVRALAPYSPRPRGFPSEVPFPFDARMVRNATLLTLDSTLGAIDLLAEVSGVDSFEAVWEKSISEQIESVEVRVVSFGDLINMKRAAGRPKDVLHLIELEALEKIVRQELVDESAGA